MKMAILFHNRFEPTLTTFFLIIDFSKEQNLNNKVTSSTQVMK